MWSVLWSRSYPKIAHILGSTVGHVGPEGVLSCLVWVKVPKGVHKPFCQQTKELAKSFKTSLLNEVKSKEVGNTKAGREFQSFPEKDMND
ncbi:hypothetical protein E2C01_002920 [Portunus trituberculatus]|uniref:Uncharacterized protein n=1 Tax=Portunus trituberculatus TaxID=210409 RepID=A0A5B7CMH8_PORTR|nr:hypothetical protein [Portunus trituberculatus]